MESALQQGVWARTVRPRVSLSGAQALCAANSIGSGSWRGERAGRVRLGSVVACRWNMRGHLQRVNLKKWRHFSEGARAARPADRACLRPAACPPARPPARPGGLSGAPCPRRGVSGDTARARPPPVGGDQLGLVARPASPPGDRRPEAAPTSVRHQRPALSAHIRPGRGLGAEPRAAYNGATVSARRMLAPLVGWPSKWVVNYNAKLGRAG